MKPKTWKEKCDIHIKTWVHSITAVPKKKPMQYSTNGFVLPDYSNWLMKF